jgi:hypothetical protein
MTAPGPEKNWIASPGAKKAAPTRRFRLNARESRSGRLGFGLFLHRT